MVVDPSVCLLFFFVSVGGEGRHPPRDTRTPLSWPTVRTRGGRGGRSGDRPRVRPRLTQIEPRYACPPALPRGIFCQIAADVDVDLHARLARIRAAWDRFRAGPEGAAHHTVRALAVADVDYLETGYCLFSLCLPDACDFRGREPATAHLVAAYRRARGIPATAVAVDIRNGLFLGGFITADALTGSRGLLNHIYRPRRIRMHARMLRAARHTDRAKASPSSVACSA